MVKISLKIYTEFKTFLRCWHLPVTCNSDPIIITTPGCWATPGRIYITTITIDTPRALPNTLCCPITSDIGGRLQAARAIGLRFKKLFYIKFWWGRVTKTIVCLWTVPWSLRFIMTILVVTHEVRITPLTHIQTTSITGKNITHGKKGRGRQTSTFGGKFFKVFNI